MLVAGEHEEEKKVVVYAIHTVNSYGVVSCKFFSPRFLGGFDKGRFSSGVRQKCLGLVLQTTFSCMVARFCQHNHPLAFHKVSQLCWRIAFLSTPSRLTVLPDRHLTCIILPHRRSRHYGCSRPCLGETHTWFGPRYWEPGVHPGYPPCRPGDSQRMTFTGTIVCVPMFSSLISKMEWVELGETTRL